MSTAVIEREQEHLVDEDNDDESAHLICCDPEWSMCGMHVPDDEYPWVDEDDGDDCPLCVIVMVSGPCRYCGLIV